jgi:SAM-dependent methyltransferase
MIFDEFLTVLASDSRWDGLTKIPWDEPGFSRRMLAEHLSQAHDGASRRTDTIDEQVNWIHSTVLAGGTGTILDLGCGPGLYLERLASMGHECTGIDFSPASIEYGRAKAAEQELPCRYVLGDVRQAPFGGEFALVMMLHGELTVFERDDAVALLRRCREATGAGRVLVEVHRRESVVAMGEQPSRVWPSLPSGLFCGGPHIRVDESRWNERLNRAERIHWIFELSTKTVERYGTATQAYSDDEYQRLLEDAGLRAIARYESLSGSGRDRDYVTLVAASV